MAVEAALEIKIPNPRRLQNPLGGSRTSEERCDGPRLAAWPCGALKPDPERLTAGLCGGRGGVTRRQSVRPVLKGRLGIATAMANEITIQCS